MRKLINSYIEDVYDILGAIMLLLIDLAESGWLIPELLLRLVYRDDKFLRRMKHEKI